MVDLENPPDAKIERRTDAEERRERAPCFGRQRNAVGPSPSEAKRATSRAHPFVTDGHGRRQDGWRCGIGVAREANSRVNVETAKRKANWKRQDSRRSSVHAGLIPKGVVDLDAQRDVLGDGPIDLYGDESERCRNPVGHDAKPAGTSVVGRVDVIRFDVRLPCTSASGYIERAGEDAQAPDER